MQITVNLLYDLYSSIHRFQRMVSLSLPILYTPISLVSVIARPKYCMYALLHAWSCVHIQPKVWGTGTTVCDNIIAGVGLTVHHIRRSETCGDNGWEELEPIHQNLQYDFNFQQTVHLPEIINVKPVSLQLCLGCAWVFGSVFVCYSCWAINEVQVRASFLGLQFVDCIVSQVIAIGLLIWNAIVAFSEQCVANLSMECCYST